jgi:glycosyltransferase involved in cell wall biosynthesis
VVILGSADSLFVGMLAEQFQRRGHVVHVVSLQDRGPAMPSGVAVIDARLGRSWAGRAALRAVRPIAHAIQRRWMERSLSRFRAATGEQRPEEWEWALWDQLEHAWRLSRIVMALQPRCVVGQELAGYGVPAALCRGVPRIMHPWGSDIFVTPESWPGADRLIRFAVRRADLLIPSSASAVEHLARRFGVSAERVCGVSFGVDPDSVVAISSEERARLCGKWGIDPNRVVVQNCRQFRRRWGCEEALAAFLLLAKERENTHFVLLGGASGVPEMDEARSRIEAAGLQGRFTVLQRRLSLQEYNELAQLSDVSVSLMTRADMRSASVLAHAAAGTPQVIAEHPEYRAMERNGFRATFVDPQDAAAAAAAMREYVDHPLLRQEVGEANRRYTLAHENQPRQLEIIMSRIDEVCRRHYGA